MHEIKKSKALASLPVRGAWIEIVNLAVSAMYDMSLPVRGAWIEIKPMNCSPALCAVAPCEGSVD